MDVLHICIGLGPLAAYLMLLGFINLRRRPFITTGARDISALGIAITGLMIVGPLDLFMPQAAAQFFGNTVWVLFITLYLLIWLLSVLVMRPRLVVYNISCEQLRTVLASLVAELDKDVRWAGDSAVLPGLGIQFNLESKSIARCAQISSVGPQQDYTGWQKLETELAARLKEEKVPGNPFAVSMVLVAIGLSVLLTVLILKDPGLVYGQLKELLRF